VGSTQNGNLTFSYMHTLFAHSSYLIEGELEIENFEMKNNNPTEDFLTIPDLAKWIRLSESHLYALVSKRKIPFIKLGGKLLFSTVQIRHWIDQNSYGPVAKKEPARRGRPPKATSGGIISTQEQSTTWRKHQQF